MLCQQYIMIHLAMLLCIHIIEMPLFKSQYNISYSTVNLRQSSRSMWPGSYLWTATTQLQGLVPSCLRLSSWPQLGSVAGALGIPLQGRR